MAQAGGGGGGPEPDAQLARRRCADDRHGFRHSSYLENDPRWCRRGVAHLQVQVGRDETRQGESDDVIAGVDTIELPGARLVRYRFSQNRRAFSQFNRHPRDRPVGRIDNGATDGAGLDRCRLADGKQAEDDERGNYTHGSPPGDCRGLRQYRIRITFGLDTGTGDLAGSRLTYLERRCPDFLQPGVRRATGAPAERSGARGPAHGVAAGAKPQR